MGGASDDVGRGGTTTLRVVGLGLGGLGVGDSGGGGGGGGTTLDVGGACTVVVVVVDELVELVSGSGMKTPGLGSGVVSVEIVVLVTLVLGMIS